MSTLLDQDTLLLNALDFEPPCETPYEPHAATHSLQCRWCGGVSFACAEHIKQAREHFSDPQIVAIHTPCGGRALDLDGLFVVVPL